MPYFYYKYYCFDDLRNYFVIANAFTTLVIGFFGLAVGAYYYYDKKNRRPKTKFLLDEINLYDQLLVGFFNQDFKDQKELDILHNRMSRGFESVLMILESSKKVLKFDNEDIRTLIIPKKSNPVSPPAEPGAYLI